MKYTQFGAWIKIKKESPPVDGWFMVRSENKKPIAMYYRAKKRSYSDSQWYIDSITGFSWGGRLHDEWLELLNET